MILYRQYLLGVVLCEGLVERWFETAAANRLLMSSELTS